MKRRNAKVCCDCKGILLVPTWKRCQECDRKVSGYQHWYKDHGMCVSCKEKPVPLGRKKFCSQECRMANEKKVDMKKSKKIRCDVLTCKRFVEKKGDRYCKHCSINQTS